MLICFFQHCICLSCLQNTFKYSADPDEVDCPFCREPIVEEGVDQFRLVKELVETSSGLENYSKKMKSYVKELENGQKKLK